MSFLVFQLRAPMASFGSSSTELRLSDRLPRRSAVTGLLAAALGIERTESARFQTLSTQVRMAVGTLKEPLAFQDFHTIQTPIFRTASSRASQIRSINKATAYAGTMVTRREYLQDGHWVVALHGAATLLGDWKAALEQPQFTLYLGRKSCPLSAFCAPAVLEAPTAEEAIAQWARQTPFAALPVVVPFQWDTDVPTTTRAELSTVRNDVRTSLLRNHFSPRTEYRGQANFGH